LKYSDDNGTTWKDFGGLDQGINGNGYITRVFADADSGFYFNDSRLLHATGPGIDPWKLISIPISWVNGITVHPDGSILASSAGSGSLGALWRSTDVGITWSPIHVSSGLSFVPNPLIPTIVPNWFVIDSNKDIITNYGPVFRSTNSGARWDSVAYIDQRGELLGAITLPNGNILQASDVDGIYRSYDNGLTWNHFYQPKYQNIYSLATNLDGYIFAGCSNSIFRSNDTGKTWNFFLIDSSIKENSALGVSCLAVDLYGDIFIFINGTNNNGWGAYRSVNNGETWSLFNLGLPDMGTHLIRSLIAAPNGTVFAITDKGIYKHDLGECEWISYSTGLTTLNIISLCIDKDGRLYAGSGGGGVFKSTETFTVTKNLIGRILAEDVDFGTVAVGDTKCEDIIIKNVGLAPFTLTKSFVVIDPTPFSVSPQSVAKMPIVIQPKDSVSISICFHPPQPAVYASEIDWTTDISDSLCVSSIKYQSFLHGTTIKSSVQISPTSINFSLHPNPTSSNTITLSFTESQSHAIPFSVYDVLGREVYRNEIIPGLKEFDIPIRELSEGIYYVRMVFNGVKMTEKFVKW